MEEFQVDVVDWLHRLVMNARPGPWWIFPDENFRPEERTDVWYGDRTLVGSVDEIGLKDPNTLTEEEAALYDRWDQAFENGELGGMVSPDRPGDARLIAAAPLLAQALLAALTVEPENAQCRSEWLATSRAGFNRGLAVVRRRIRNVLEGEWDGELVVRSEQV